MKFLAFLVVVIGVLLCLPVRGEETSANCFPVGELSAELKKSYQEELTARGKDTIGSVMAIFTSPSGTWTLVKVTADGMACLVAAGEEFKLAPGKGA